MTDKRKPTPKFTPDAAANLGFEGVEIAAAIKWFESDTSRHAVSFNEQYQLRGKLSHKQWALAVDRAKKVDFDAGNTGITGITNNRFSLSPTQRSILKKAAGDSAGWTAYMSDMKRTTGDHTWNSRKLSGEVLWDCLDALGIDAKVALRGAADAAKGAIDKAVEETAKGSTQVDWKRVHRICREEIERRVKPVVEQVVVLETKKGKKRKVKGGAPQHPMFARLLRSVTNKIPTLLVGPTGTGKTYAGEQIAKLLKVPFHLQGVALEPFDLVGYVKIDGTFKDTAFVRAFEHGGVCLIDEIERFDPKALVSLNAALANGFITLDDGRVIKQHKNFYAIGSGNTYGMGGSADYTAAEKLDLSTISRFAVRLAWDVDEATERAILAYEFPDHQTVAVAWYEEVLRVREAMARLDLPWLADQRCITAGTKLLLDGATVEEAREDTYLATLDTDQRRAVLSGANIKHEV